jgi:hypothetical protein
LLQEAAFDAALHDTPDSQDAFAYLPRRAPSALVFVHELKDLKASFTTVIQQLGSRAEEIGYLANSGWPRIITLLS